MIKEIPKSDIITRPIKVYKEWPLDETMVKPIFAKSGSFGNYDAEIEEKSYGFSKISLFRSIKAQFYTNAETASVLFEVGRRNPNIRTLDNGRQVYNAYASKDERNLSNEFAVIPISQSQYGEGIKVGSVRLEDKETGKIYEDDGYSNLIDSGSNVAGNIFYDRGLVVLTRDVVSGSVLSQFTLNFRSTKTIYENEILLSVLESEFNVSQNPTAVDYDADGKFGKIKLHSIQSNVNPNVFSGFGEYDYSSSLDTTGSYLAPYVTTIGLYDDDLNMVAVAKLPQPIKSMPDYPLNFIVRFDT
jgi:hypothetical protein